VALPHAGVSIEANARHRMSITSSIKRFHRRATASGSPFRFLRKGWLNLRHPGATWARARAARPLVEAQEPWFQERTTELAANGFVYGGDEIDAGLLAELDRQAMARVESPSDGRDLSKFAKEFIKEEDLRSDSIFVRFALQPAVLKVACAYFGGRVPVLDDIQLLLSHGSQFTGRWQDSQLWHRDYNDARMLKFWVYLNDVTKTEDGPFTYLPYPASRKVPNNFFPGRVSDDALQASGLAGQAKEILGERLRTFYIDTGRCYHLGSRLQEGRTRYAYLATFVSHAPLYPSNNGMKVATGASEIERLALTP